MAAWVTAHTNNGALDVLVLYGYVPETIYPAVNGRADGSIAELFIESTDGDTIINHAGYMFLTTNPTWNLDRALKNMMDTPGISMWDAWHMCVTDEGKEISPSLAEYQGAELSYWTAYPLHVDLLGGDWFVEAALGESTTGTRADPVIVRDGNRGRLVPIFQSLDRDNPKGAVAAEIISWLMNKKDVPLTAFTRGDANGDAAIDIGDAICAIEYLFGQSADPCKAKVPRCFDAADANDSGALDTADAIEILDHLFAHTGPLPVPFGSCGIDPTTDELDCASFPPCE